MLSGKSSWFDNCYWRLTWKYVTNKSWSWMDDTRILTLGADSNLNSDGRKAPATSTTVYQLLPRKVVAYAILVLELKFLPASSLKFKLYVSYTAIKFYYLVINKPRQVIILFIKCQCFHKLSNLVSSNWGHDVGYIRSRRMFSASWLHMSLCFE